MRETVGMNDVHQWVAPGRVNLIGDHLDYNGGPVLPIAIDRTLSLKARLRDDSAVRVWSTVGAREQREFDTGAAPGEVTGWAAYVAGVFWAVRELGHRVPGADLVLDGDLPLGAGLSSSAAVEALVASALNDLCELGLDRLSLARLCRRAENDFVAVPCGFMDQLAVLHGEADQAMLIDLAAEPPSIEPVAADWGAAGLSLIVIDTMTRHRLNDGQYAQRRDECAQASAVLGLDHLAAAGPDAIFKLDDEILKARTRHVITETARVRGAARAMRSGNWEQFGTMMTASHQSLRDDFAVSRIELDVAVEAALEAGAHGARMTGAGFGGSAIALVDSDQRAQLRDAVLARFDFHQFTAPTLFEVHPADGVQEVAITA